MENKNKVEIKVTFDTVWQFMWRWIVLAFGLWIAICVLAMIISLMIS